MTAQTQNSEASAAVKGRIFSRVAKLGDLAGAAGIAQSTLSQYIAGTRNKYETQIAIYNAFCRLASIAPTRRGEKAFWGALLNRAA